MYHSYQCPWHCIPDSHLTLCTVLPLTNAPLPLLPNPLVRIPIALLPFSISHAPIGLTQFSVSNAPLALFPSLAMLHQHCSMFCRQCSPGIAPPLWLHQHCFPFVCNAPQHCSPFVCNAPWHCSPFMYRNESNNSNKLNSFISGVRILWNTLINNFSRKRGVFKLLEELFETQIYNNTVHTHYIHYQLL